MRLCTARTSRNRLKRSGLEGHAAVGGFRLPTLKASSRDELRRSMSGNRDGRVAFDGPATFDACFELEDYLEELLCRSVDLATRKGLEPRARQHVERGLIRVT